MIIAIIIFLYIVYKINQAATRDMSNSSAGRWAADVCRACEQDAINYNRKREMKYNLLEQANQLERQSRYGTGYERKALMKQAKELRRQAYNL